MVKLPVNWQVAKPVVEQAMLGMGLSVFQSFDLKPAEGLVDDCNCPFHGMNECDCEYIVLLIYSNDKPPFTLVGHGHSKGVVFDLSGIPYYRIQSETMAEQISGAFHQACHTLVERNHAG